MTCAPMSPPVGVLFANTRLRWITWSVANRHPPTTISAVKYWAIRSAGHGEFIHSDGRRTMRRHTLVAVDGSCSSTSSSPSTFVRDAPGSTAKYSSLQCGESESSSGAAGGATVPPSDACRIGSSSGKSVMPEEIVPCETTESSSRLDRS